MRAKTKIGILFGAILLAIPTTGCHFPSFIPPEVVDVELTTNSIKSFVAGDSVLDCIEIEMVSHYSDGKTKELLVDDAYLEYYSETTYITYSVDTPIPEAGNYQLVAWLDGVRSESFAFTALEEHVYVTDMKYEDEEYISLGSHQEKTISLSVYPEGYTEAISCNVYDSTIVEVKRDKNNSFIVKSLSRGATTICFSSLSGEDGTRINREVRVNVQDIYCTNLEIDFAPQDMSVKGTENIELIVEPENITVPVFVEIDNESLVSVYEIDPPDLWEIYGKRPGVTTVTFYAAYCEDDYLDVSFTIGVHDLYVNELSVQEDYYEVGVDHSVLVGLNVAPSYYTVDLCCLDDYDQNIIDVRYFDDEYFEIYGKAYGKTTVTFCAQNEWDSHIYCSCVVEVKDIYATSISAYCEFTSIYVGGTIPVTLEILPSNFAASFSYYSSNNSIAKVSPNRSDFTITGVAAGKAKIWFVAASGNNSFIKDYVDITVVTLTATTTTKLSQKFSTLIKNKEEKDTVMESTGKVKMLVIPIWFTDSWKYIGGEDPNKTKTVSKQYFYNPSNTPWILNPNLLKLSNKVLIKNDIYQAFFGNEETTGWHSVSTYYREDSNRRLSISGTVANWYPAEMSSIDFVTKDAYNWNDLLVEAFNWYFEVDNPEDKPSNYDVDKDGYVDSVALIYGSPNENCYQYRQEFNGMALNINKNGKFHSTTRRLKNAQLKSVSNPGPNNYFNASYTSMYNKTNALAKTGFPYNSCHNSLATIDSRTYCHETGHLFGLPDLYDTGKNKGADFSSGLTMQASDNGYHDPFSAMALGWVDPIIPTDSCTVFITNYSYSHSVILLTPEFNKLNSPFDEYIALELFAPTGLFEQDVDAKYTSLKNTVGIRMYHVNSKLLVPVNEKEGTFYFTSDARIKGARLAFNNTYDFTVDGGSTCNAAQYVSRYQSYSLVHFIRHDYGIGTEYEIGYFSKESLFRSHLFSVGDIFKFEDYKNQFVIPYLTGQCTLDFGQELGWKFRVNVIGQIGKSNNYGAIITFEKTK